MSRRYWRRRGCYMRMCYRKFGLFPSGDLSGSPLVFLEIRDIIGGVTIDSGGGFTS